MLFLIEGISMQCEMQSKQLTLAGHMDSLLPGLGASFGIVSMRCLSRLLRGGAGSELSSSFGSGQGGRHPVDMRGPLL